MDKDLRKLILITYRLNHIIGYKNFTWKYFIKFLISRYEL